MSEAEKQLLEALAWLLRVSQGGAYDDDDLTSAHEYAEQLIAKYSATDEDDDE